MAWVLSQILALIGVALLVLIGAAVFAPLESLGWFAGWSGKPPKFKELAQEGIDEQTGEYSEPEMETYIVYLSGIGVASADGLAPDEVDFIHELGRVLDDEAIITDVFPYSVNNNPLTGQRALTPLWKKVRDLQIKNPNSPVALIMINVRNMLQVAVSADPRYGPIYNLGVAEEIARSLARHGYRLKSNKPVFLIGFSGGGQVSVGSATYLAAMIEAPVYIVSIGGVISDDPGINYVKHLTHFFGDKDPLQGIGAILWSGRWKMFPQSDWNRARAQGRITFVDLGPMAHNSTGGYYDVNVKLSDGRSNCEATAAAVKNAILTYSR
jgi:hypothetical protein